MGDSNIDAGKSNLNNVIETKDKNKDKAIDDNEKKELVADKEFLQLLNNLRKFWERTDHDPSKNVEWQLKREALKSAVKDVTKEYQGLDFHEVMFWITSGFTNSKVETGGYYALNRLLQNNYFYTKIQKPRDIKDIQNILLNLGFDIGSSGKLGDGVDGDYGETIKNAVKELQKWLGLNEGDCNGEINKTTIAALTERLAMKNENVDISFLKKLIEYLYAPNYGYFSKYENTYRIKVKNYDLILLNGSDRSKETGGTIENENNGKKLIIPYSPEDKYVPGMRKEVMLTPEKIKTGSYFYKVEPPLGYTENFRMGVYSTFDIKGNAILEQSDFSVVHLPVTGESLPYGVGETKYTLTSQTKGGETILPVPMGFHVNNIISPKGAELMQNRNGIYKVKYPDSQKPIPVKIECSAEQRSEFKILPDANSIYKYKFLGDFTGKPQFENLKHQPLTAQNTLKIVGDISMYLMENSFYGQKEEYSNYYQKADNYFKALEERLFVKDKGKPMMVMDCDIANMYGVGLLRESGIPARMVTGHMGQSKVGLRAHAWTEYWNGEKWIEIDFTPIKLLPEDLQKAEQAEFEYKQKEYETEKQKKEERKFKKLQPKKPIIDTTNYILG